MRDMNFRTDKRIDFEATFSHELSTTIPQLAQTSPTWPASRPNSNAPATPTPGPMSPSSMCATPRALPASQTNGTIATTDTSILDTPAHRVGKHGRSGSKANRMSIFKRAVPEPAEALQAKLANSGARADGFEGRERKQSVESSRSRGLSHSRSKSRDNESASRGDKRKSFFSRGDNSVFRTGPGVSEGSKESLTENGDESSRRDRDKVANGRRSSSSARRPETATSKSSAGLSLGPYNSAKSSGTRSAKGVKKRLSILGMGMGIGVKKNGMVGVVEE
jgi:hypothetical protein